MSLLPNLLEALVSPQVRVGIVPNISMASNSNVESHSWSDQKGGSFELAARVIALGATNIAAFCVSLYVFKQHMHRSNQHASMIALASAHLCAVVEMGLLVASCYHGWGSEVDLLTQPLLADKYFFASIILSVLVHGFSRLSLCATFRKANKRTRFSSYANALLFAILLWATLSVLGVFLHRWSSSGLWTRIGTDCDSKVWFGVGVAGMTIDTAITGMSIYLVANLQMTRAKKLYTISVFSAGLLTNVPLIYGATYLSAYSLQVEADPSAYSTKFVYANQVAIAVSLWCRAIEAARRLQKDFGYVSWGHMVFEGNGGSDQGRTQCTAGPTGQAFSDSRKRTIQAAEDEIRLRDLGENMRYVASVRAETESDRLLHDGIEITRQVCVE